MHVHIANILQNTNTEMIKLSLKPLIYNEGRNPAGKFSIYILLYSIFC